MNNLCNPQDKKKERFDLHQLKDSYQLKDIHHLLLYNKPYEQNPELL